MVVTDWLGAFGLMVLTDWLGGLGRTVLTDGGGLGLDDVGC